MPIIIVRDLDRYSNEPIKRSIPHCLIARKHILISGNVENKFKQVISMSEHVVACSKLFPMASFVQLFKFMHQYSNKKLPISFSDIFTDIINSDNLQSRHNEYNCVIYPAVKKKLKLFPYRKILFNWNSLDIDLKATADAEEFKILMKNKLVSQFFV